MILLRFLPLPAYRSLESSQDTDVFSDDDSSIIMSSLASRIYSGYVDCNTCVFLLFKAELPMALLPFSRDFSRDLSCV